MNKDSNQQSLNPNSNNKDRELEESKVNGRKEDDSLDNDENQQKESREKNEKPPLENGEIQDLKQKNLNHNSNIEDIEFQESFEHDRKEEYYDDNYVNYQQESKQKNEKPPLENCKSQDQKQKNLNHNSNNEDIELGHRLGDDRNRDYSQEDDENQQQEPIQKNEKPLLENGVNYQQEPIQKNEKPPLEDNENYQQEPIQKNEKLITQLGQYESSLTEEPLILNMEEENPKSEDIQQENSNKSNQLLYLKQYQESNKSYKINLEDYGTFVEKVAKKQIEKGVQKYITKNYVGSIFWMFVKYPENDLINYKLDKLLEEKNNNWSFYCDFNQAIKIEKLVNETLSYSNLMRCNKIIKKNKLSSQIKECRNLCLQEGFTLAIERIETFQVCRTIIKTFRQQYKGKNDILLTHISALEEFINIVEYLKKKNRNMKKTIFIGKTDIKQLIKDPEIYEQSKNILKKIEEKIRQIENENENEVTKSSWKFFQKKVMKLFQIDSKSQNSQKKYQSKKIQKLEQFYHECLNV